jgi:hypothetical protein
MIAAEVHVILSEEDKGMPHVIDSAEIGGHNTRSGTGAIDQIQPFQHFAKDDSGLTLPSAEVAKVTGDDIRITITQHTAERGVVPGRAGLRRLSLSAHAESVTRPLLRRAFDHQ